MCTVWKSCFAVAMLAVVGLAAGCGGDDGPLEGDSLADAADEICAEYEERFARSGNIGLTNDQIAEEFTYANQLAVERQQRLRDLEVAAEDAEEWQEFLSYGDRFIEINRQIVRAARADETARVMAGFNQLLEPANERESLAEELGMEVCAAPTDPEVEETGIEPPGDLDYIEPANSVEEAVEEILAAVEDEDCERLGAAAHSNLGWFDESICAELYTSFGGAEVLGSEEHGPAAVAEIESEFGDRFTLYFVTGDEDLYRYAGHAQNEDRGLRPANEDADAEPTVEEMLEILAAEEHQRREELLADPDHDPMPIELALALAEGEEAETALLGLNQALSLHHVEIGDGAYVLVLHHMPGGRSEYRIADVVLPAAEFDAEAQAEDHD